MGHYYTKVETNLHMLTVLLEDFYYMCISFKAMDYTYGITN